MTHYLSYPELPGHIQIDRYNAPNSLNLIQLAPTYLPIYTITRLLLQVLQANNHKTIATATLIEHPQAQYP